MILFGAWLSVMTSAERGRVFAVSQYKSVQVSKISKIIKPLHAFLAQPMTLQCNTETRGISHVCETGVARKCMAFRAIELEDTCGLFQTMKLQKQTRRVRRVGEWSPLWIQMAVSLPR